MMMIVKGDDCDDILMIVKTWKMMIYDDDCDDIDDDVYIYKEHC